MNFNVEKIITSKWTKRIVILYLFSFIMLLLQEFFKVESTVFNSYLVGLIGLQGMIISNHLKIWVCGKKHQLRKLSEDAIFIIGVTLIGTTCLIVALFHPEKISPFPWVILFYIGLLPGWLILLYFQLQIGMETLNDLTSPSH